MIFRFAVLLLMSLTSGAVAAQGMDSTPAERQLRVLAEMLPGHYSNANQVYFDGRRQLPQNQRHALRTVVVEPMAAYEGSGKAFLWREASAEWRLLLTTTAADPLGVSAEFAVLKDGSWREEPARRLRILRTAESFTGSGAERRSLQVSARELWLDSGDGDPDWLERSRTFHCYVDIPGVGGGATIPFRRYDGLELHDQGGEHWLDGPDGRRLGIRLLRVNWHVLNERNGAFNRNSLVLYVSERLNDGATIEHGYAFTAPDADRVGVNLKWLLVNCAVTPRELARPAM